MATRTDIVWAAEGLAGRSMLQLGILPLEGLWVQTAGSYTKFDWAQSPENKLLVWIASEALTYLR